MRVMMLGPYPRSPHRIDGGVAAAMTYLSTALRETSGVELVGVRLASVPSGRDGADFPWPVVDLPLERLSLSTLYARQKSQLAKLIHRFRPEIVHAQGTDVAGFVAVTCGLPTVVTVHGLLAECAKYQTDTVARWRAKLVAHLTERASVRKAANLISISPYVRQYYGDEIRGRVYDIPNAVAPAYFSIPRSPEKGRMLYAGRIARGKGLVELLEASARQRGSVTRIVLAGGTPDPAYGTMLRDLAEGLGIASVVKFAGLLSEPSLSREFALAEALVLPSFQETAPMVVQQAMAAGLAVVASAVGGIPSQVQHEVNGLLFPAGDTGRLSDLLARLKDEKDLSERLGRAAKAHAEANWRATAVANATIDVYRDMLSTHKVKATAR